MVARKELAVSGRGCKGREGEEMRGSQNGSKRMVSCELHTASALIMNRVNVTSLLPSPALPLLFPGRSSLKDREDHEGFLPVPSPHSRHVAVEERKLLAVPHAH